jgi:CheY-like chemotaxis protein
MRSEILKDRKILIVEDDLSSRLYLNKVLERAGAEILNAGDGKEAVKMACEINDIDLILMDIQLPVMDGYLAAKEIRKSGRQIKIVAQTAYGLSSDMEEILDSGFDDYVIKPIYADHLIKKLTELFLSEQATQDKLKA